MIEHPSLRDPGGSEPPEVAELVSMADYLAHHLVSSNAISSMLPCLGYRVKPSVQLIFQIPPDLERPQTLNDLITATVTIISHTDEAFRKQRLQLGRQLSEAIYSVHMAQLVHKNVRPETIVVLDPIKGNNVGEDSLKLGLPFLTDWNMLRDVEDPSSRTGDDDWIRDIYRHPNWQGLQPERRYNINTSRFQYSIRILGSVLGTVRIIWARVRPSIPVQKLHTIKIWKHGSRMPEEEQPVIQELGLICPYRMIAQIVCVLSSQVTSLILKNWKPNEQLVHGRDSERGTYGKYVAGSYFAKKNSIY